MVEFGHTQVCDGDEVGRRSEAACGVLGVLQQAVHGLGEGVGPVVDHSPHHGLGNRLGQLLERIQPAVSCPAQAGAQVAAGQQVRRASPQKINLFAESL